MWNPDDELLEALDACRADHDDAQRGAQAGDSRMGRLAEALSKDRQLRTRQERLAQLDARLQAALSQAVVPEGLESHVLAALAAAPGVVNPLAEPAASDQPTTLPVACSPEKAVERSRQIRRWICGTAALAASLAVVAALLPRGGIYDLDAVYRDARRHFESAEVAREPAYLLADRPAPKGFRVSRFVSSNEGPHTAWRWVKGTGLFGRTGVAYELASAEGTTARLYVLRLHASPRAPDLRKVLPHSPPERPVFTENLTTAAWQEGGLVYVLVVPGPEASYRQFLRPARGVAQRQSWPAPSGEQLLAVLAR